MLAHDAALFIPGLLFNAVNPERRRRVDFMRLPKPKDPYRYNAVVAAQLSSSYHSHRRLTRPWLIMPSRLRPSLLRAKG